MARSEDQKPLDTTTFLKIRSRYLLALAGIALTVIIGQVLIQIHLNSQLNDSRVINVAGRQRALSQKLVKEVLLLKDAVSNKDRQQLTLEIQKTLAVWKTAHISLQKGSKLLNLPVEKDLEILLLFQKISRNHFAMVAAVEALLYQGIPLAPFKKQVAKILINERTFLSKMDGIVNKYDARSKEKLKNLRQKEFWLLGFSLFILMVEFLFIFKPLSIQIRKTISNLLHSQLLADSNTQKIGVLLLEKQNSLSALQELNFVIDNAALFASAKKDGSVVFISKKFLTLLSLTKEQLNKPLAELLTTDAGQQQYLKELLKNNHNHNIRNEEIAIVTHSGKRCWLDISIVPMHKASQQQSVLILCSDSTERKQQELKVAALTQQNFEERVLQKKIRASQIVEGQEEERKRIAKDIHDGIGQMLTALRFNIESIDVIDTPKTIEKISYLKNLTTDLIRGVRTATFNLTPPELSDHGVFPALHKMTVTLSKLTGKTILFENKTNQNYRFNSLAETNLYRVTQEAVNNAIKYAQANYILVTINFKDTILSIVIDDDGAGFDTAILNKLPKNSSEGGMGLYFMKERISYINGRLFITSQIGKGTRVTINYSPTESIDSYLEDC